MIGWPTIAWLVEALIASTGLMLLVLVLRDPVRRTFGAHAAYALWLLPALRMILPPLGALFPQAAHVNAVTQASGALGEMVRDQILRDILTGPLAAAPAATPVDQAAPLWPTLLAGAWVVGFALFAVGQLLAYRRFRRFVLSEATLQDEIEPGIFLLNSPRVKGPMAFGLRRRVIVFPVDAHKRFDEEEQAMALAHELAHHVRGDLIANAVALLMLCLHWCNPVAWIAYRAFRNDQEIACDADVIDAVRGSRLGHAYGRALVKSASGREFAAACNLTTVDRLKRRLKMLSSKSLSARRRRIGVFLTGGVVLAGLTLTASGQGIAAQMGANVSDQMRSALPLHQAKALLPGFAASLDADAANADAAGHRADRLARGSDVAAVDLPASNVPPAPSAPPAPPSNADAPMPPTPPVPPMPAIAAIPPIPAMPPVPPMLPKTSGRHHHAPMDAARLADINARVPIVEVKQGGNCSVMDQMVRSSEQSVMVDGQSRKKILITICGKDMVRFARARALEGMKLARANIEDGQMWADQASDRADRARDMAERSQEQAEQARDRAMADLDRQIARMEAEQDRD